MKKQNDEITLYGLWEMFLPKLWIIALVSVIFAAVFGVYTMFIKKDTYTSTVDFYTRGNETGNTTSDDLSYAQSMVGMFSEYIQLVGFRNHVLQKLYALEDNGVKRYDEEDIKIEDLLDMVSIAQRGKTSLFVITVVAEDLRLSEDIASVIRNELPVKLKEDLKHAAEIESYLDVPHDGKADEKGTLQSVAIGFVIGLVLSIVSIFLFVRLDTIIRSKKKLEDNFDLPILGVIPAINAEVKAPQQ